MLLPLACRALLFVTLLPVGLRAEQAVAEAPPAPAAASAPAPAPAAGSAEAPPDEEGNPAISDFTSVNLPTTLRLPRHKLAFRVTHRFARPLGDGDFGDLAGDFFGFDSGAQIGMELRFGLFTGTQLGVYRTSDRTIQLFARQDLMQQQESRPFGLAALATFEGIDNLHAERSPGLSLVVSRTFGERAALYAIPGWVDNTNLVDEGGDQNDTFILGLAGRLRLGEDYAIVGEVMPRVGGFKDQATQIEFGFERRAGGHNFQINFGTGLGSTLAQVARGFGPGDGDRHWYMGFNLARKFY